MKIKFTFLIAVLVGWFSAINAQTTLSTTSAFLNNNGTGMVTFNFENTNNFAVRITTVEGVVGTAGANTADIYYKPGAISVNPGVITATNGWI
ncbi:MAG: hypothetical protein ACK44D_13510, partial [Bacteroidia bacterium]